MKRLNPALIITPSPFPINLFHNQHDPSLAQPSKLPIVLVVALGLLSLVSAVSHSNAYVLTSGEKLKMNTASTRQLIRMSRNLTACLNQLGVQAKRTQGPVSVISLLLLTVSAKHFAAFCF